MRSSRLMPSRKQHKLRPSELIRVYRVLRKTFGHQHWWPGDTPFEVMVGAILTQNTAWVNVEKAILNLKEANMLSLRAFHKITRQALSRLIRPAGYFNIKADRLKHFVDFLIKEFHGNIALMKKESMPVLREKLLTVKGVGSETADSILLYALNKRTFVIDAYTKRIFSRHGLASHDLDYAVWQELFVRALPRDIALYNDYHALIVRVGKDHCRKIPRCGACPLNLFFGKGKKNTILCK